MKHRSRVRSVTPFLLAASLALCAGSASAAGGFSTTIGPVPLSPAPVKFCAGTACQKTPTLSSVTLTVGVVPDHLLGIAPSVAPVACPWGQRGAALLIQANTSDASISGVLEGTTSNGKTTRSFGPIRLNANRNLVVSACTF